MTNENNGQMPLPGPNPQALMQLMAAPAQVFGEQSAIIAEAAQKQVDAFNLGAQSFINGLQAPFQSRSPSLVQEFVLGPSKLVSAVTGKGPNGEMGQNTTSTFGAPASAPGMPGFPGTGQGTRRIDETTGKTPTF